MAAHGGHFMHSGWRWHNDNDEISGVEKKDDNYMEKNNWKVEEGGGATTIVKP